MPAQLLHDGQTLMSMVGVAVLLLAMYRHGVRGKACVAQGRPLRGAAIERRSG